MTTCLGFSCLFDLLCVSFVNVYQLVFVLISCWFLKYWDVGFDCTVDFRYLEVEGTP